MGAIMHSYWIQYHMRLFEPQWFGGAERIEKCLSRMESNGGEDSSFRQHVIDLVNNSGKDDPYWMPDKRKYNFLCKNLEARTTLRDIVPPLPQIEELFASSS